jgi:hypothetical protein
MGGVVKKAKGFIKKVKKAVHGVVGVDDPKVQRQQKAGAADTLAADDRASEAESRQRRAGQRSGRAATMLGGDDGMVSPTKKKRLGGDY